MFLQRSTLVFFVLMLVSCGSLESQLEERVSARWAALSSGDMIGVYAFFSPEYRKLYSVDSFVKKMGGSVEWKSVSVDTVSIEDDEVAKVTLSVVYALSLPTVGGAELGKSLGDITSSVEEFWVYRSGEWWYASKVTASL